MPNLPLPSTDFLGDGQRTTAEFQDAIDQVQNWLIVAQAELDALSDTTFGEAAVRGVGNLTGDVPDKAVLDTRLGTSGNLGTVAQEDSGIDDGEVPVIMYQDVTIEGDFTPFTLHCQRIGRVVTLWADDVVSHSSSFSPQSQSGVIPIDFRPPIDSTATSAQVFGSLIQGVWSMGSGANQGAFRIQYTDIQDAGFETRTASLWPPIITYGV